MDGDIEVSLQIAAEGMKEYLWGTQFCKHFLI